MVDCTLRIHDVYDANHDTGRSNNEPTTNKTHDNIINYVMNDIVQSNNSDMNSNNDNNVKVNVNCDYDDTDNNPSKYYDDYGNSNILSFYLL